MRLYQAMFISKVDGSIVGVSSCVFKTSNEALAFGEHTRSKSSNTFVDYQEVYITEGRGVK